MKTNLGGMDRVVRLIVGAVLLVIGLMVGIAAPWNYVLDAVGGILILTAGIKFCPAYVLFGASTCKTCEKD